MATLYLEHHGIKGQKWGVRRFQNEDGSLTRKGRKRYLEQNKERITYAKEALDVTKNLSKQSLEKAKAFDKKFNEFTDQLSKKYPEAQYEPFDDQMQLLSKKEREKFEKWKKTSGDLWSQAFKSRVDAAAIESYLQVISYMPIDEVNTRLVSRGREAVLSYTKDKYHTSY